METEIEMETEDKKWAVKVVSSKHGIVVHNERPQFAAFYQEPDGLDADTEIVNSNNRHFIGGMVFHSVTWSNPGRVSSKKETDELLALAADAIHEAKGSLAKAPLVTDQ